MLQYYFNKNTKGENDPIVINQMTWSILRRNLKTFLDASWIQGHQLVIFRHSSLEKVYEKTKNLSLNIEFLFIRNYDNVYSKKIQMKYIL
jgi:hypothetical protein